MSQGSLLQCRQVFGQRGAREKMLTDGDAFPSHPMVAASVSHRSPPAKRAKTAEVRLSSASDVPMTPRSDDNAKGSSEKQVTALAQTLMLAAKMTPRMFLIWRNLKKRIPTSVLSLMEWTHKLWNGIALVTQMMRCLALTSWRDGDVILPSQCSQILAAG